MKAFTKKRKETRPRTFGVLAGVGRSFVIMLCVIRFNCYRAPPRSTITELYYFCVQFEYDSITTFGIRPHAGHKTQCSDAAYPSAPGQTTWRRPTQRDDRNGIRCLGVLPPRPGQRRHIKRQSVGRGIRVGVDLGLTTHYPHVWRCTRRACAQPRRVGRESVVAALRFLHGDGRSGPRRCRLA